MRNVEFDLPPSCCILDKFINFAYHHPLRLGNTEGFGDLEKIVSYQFARFLSTLSVFGDNKALMPPWTLQLSLKIQLQFTGPDIFSAMAWNTDAIYRYRVMILVNFAAFQPVCLSEFNILVYEYIIQDVDLEKFKKLAYINLKAVLQSLSVRVEVSHV
ncbi:hypothetical protein KL921_001838 [Ogataea angusta]|nr:hypothetical protein KL921_001838 [Ogataea angusta]KAG7831078.1 hypothetical protein KL920_001669 [Ogataea angusta]KAG7860549.1 hypothetical protein KL939_002035 [Ogataea angusta]KAG7861565.1 hypothetical protein KL919_002299 [Ogataea angusta]